MWAQLGSGHPVLSLRPRLALRADGSRQTRQTGASSCLAWACSQPSRNRVKIAPARGKPRHRQTTPVSHYWAVAEPRFELTARPWPPQSAGPLAAEAPSYAGSRPSSVQAVRLQAVALSVLSDVCAEVTQHPLLSGGNSRSSPCLGDGDAQSSTSPPAGLAPQEQGSLGHRTRCVTDSLRRPRSSIPCLGLPATLPEQ